MIEYNYNIDTVCVPQLSVEIQNGIDINVNGTIDNYDGYLLVSGSLIITGSFYNRCFLIDSSRIKVMLKESLSTPNKSSLDNIITSHIPNPNYPTGSAG